MQMRGIENKIFLPLPLYRAFEKTKQEKNLLA
jgi:hypothetical protein